MASSGKRKTTMAKLNRERGLLERRAKKQARKVARKSESVEGPVYGDLHVESALDPDDLPPSVDLSD